MVSATVCGRRLQRDGMLVDFSEVKAALKKILDGLDHRDLNAIRATSRPNPTSENLAFHIFRRLAVSFKGRPCRVCRVSVRESPGNEAAYCEKT
jgi:6-pyruvoyltetrahydropterin/6-carboxytetrahydropterin synthase